jgi:hypothetical protein
LIVACKGKHSIAANPSFVFGKVDNRAVATIDTIMFIKAVVYVDVIAFHNVVLTW